MSKSCLYSMLFLELDIVKKALCHEKVGQNSLFVKN